MTKENQKILYEHYVKVGNQKNIEMMLKAYPEFANEVKAKEEIKEKSKK